MKKFISITLFSGLTVAAASACSWQYRRYNDCVIKWQRIHSQFNTTHVPQKYQLSEVLNFNLTDWEYMVLEVEAESFTNKIKLVSRYREGRNGSMVISAIKQNDQGLLVNLGWVPEEMISTVIENPQFLEAMSKLKIIRCMIKKPEIKDFLTEKKGAEMQMSTFIDIKEFSHYFEIPENTFYIDRVGKEDESGGIGDDLYPTPVFGSSLEKPYLTPDKHQGYYLFWGSCTTLGIMTLLKLIKM